MEPEWRAGIITKLALSEKYKVSRAAIDKHWAKLGIERDLTEKIRQEVAARVTHDAVTREVTQLDRVTEKELVEANAEIQVNVIRGQRKDVTRHRGLVSKLFAELEATSDGLELMEQIGELMASPDEAGIDKLNDLYRKVISLPGRVDMVKKLVETLEKLINAERRVFNIKDDSGSDTPPLVGVVRLVPLSAADSD